MGTPAQGPGPDGAGSRRHLKLVGWLKSRTTAERAALADYWRGYSDAYLGTTLAVRSCSREYENGYKTGTLTWKQDGQPSYRPRQPRKP